MLLSHVRLIDTPELGPGTILGPNGPSFSSSIGPSSTIFIPAYSSSSSTQVTTTTTSNPRPAGHNAGGHSSNAGAIAGGTVAGVVAISIAVLALFFYRQRRLSQARKPNIIEDPPLPTSGQETATSTLPGTSSSMLRPFVRSRIPNPLLPVTLVCSCVFSHLSTHRTRRTQLHSLRTKHLRTRLPPQLRLRHLPHRTSNMYTPLPPRRAPKHRDMGAEYFLISPFEAIAVVWRGFHCASVFSFPRFHFRGCVCEQQSFPFFFLRGIILY